VSFIIPFAFILQEDTMSQSLLDLAYQLTHAGEPFVLATVVRCERPTSAKPGAQAIIQQDGKITGWIGGNCAQPIVIREAIRIFREGDNPYLLHLGTSENDTNIKRQHDTNITRQDVRTFLMTCASGGALEIYMEPHLPQPQLLLIGNSPVINALRQLAPVINFSVTQLDHTDFSQVHIDERTYILIATHGQYDEDALEQALTSPAHYIGMVGSPRRAEACRAYLRTSGLSEEQIARLKAPAGLDIGAVTPEEIAASIISELIQVQRRGLPVDEHPEHHLTETPASSEVSALPVVAETAIDLVCGMTVEIATARHHVSYDGREFYFCCPACKRQFERNPQEYLAARP
jgi:xanthine dehydrogenase accessory factor